MQIACVTIAWLVHTGQAEPGGHERCAPIVPGMAKTLTAAQADTSATTDPWGGFAGGPWQDAIDVSDFIQRNYTPYEGDASFLSGLSAY